MLSLAQTMSASRPLINELIIGRLCQFVLYYRIIDVLVVQTQSMYSQYSLHPAYLVRVARDDRSWMSEHQRYNHDARKEQPRRRVRSPARPSRRVAASPLCGLEVAVVSKDLDCAHHCMRARLLAISRGGWLYLGPCFTSPALRQRGAAAGEAAGGAAGGGATTGAVARRPVWRHHCRLRG